MRKVRSKKRIGWIILGILIAFLLFVVLYYLGGRLLPRPYTARELGITTLQSDRDYDQDGIDDYTDMLLGAKAYIAEKPKYKSKYYAGGYPNDDYGVCTDVIWSAMEEAGYSLKDAVDKDIAEHPEAYPDILSPDPNIDFRRVRNLRVFFARHAEQITLDQSEPNQWQPGDIVIFRESHIGILSDKRNENGIPYVIHHTPGGVRENDVIGADNIASHYRWYPAKTP